jgi:regulator of sigma E protease
MTLLLTIVAFVIIFSLLILIHELGHFLVAKKSGIKVEEFGLGIPPKVWGFRPKDSETEYTINAIPFGGFVRLYGEDIEDEKALKSHRSFSGKPAWIKILVVVAGVIMNFILAFVLLTIGFIVGIQPLFVSPQDVYQGINNGTIKLEQGIVVKEPLSKDLDFQQGDRIISVNDGKIELGNEVSSLKDNQAVKFEIERKGKTLVLNGVNKSSSPFFKSYDPISVPRIIIKNVSSGSSLARAGIRSGDMIFKINDEQIFDFTGFEKALSGNKELKIDLIREGQLVSTTILQNENADLVISAVLPDSPAEQEKLRPGDEVLAINGKQVSSVQDVAKVMGDDAAKSKVTYEIKRGENLLEVFLTKDEKGYVGVLLSELHSMDQSGFSYYVKSVPYSVISIDNVSYPFWQAPGKAFVEMGRLSAVTVQMFVNVFTQVVTRFSVPEGVAGPVGIAQMTYTFVQEGFMSLLRFTALLSLSLGIINILPFPGLDGGRFLLIFVSVLIGKKISPKWEGVIHMVGFLVLMMLILLITIHDIWKIGQ